MSGTSMSCPHVAGGVAIFLAMHPEFSPDEILETLTERSTSIIDHALPSTTNDLLYTFDGLDPRVSNSIPVYEIVLIAVGAFLGVALLWCLWHKLYRSRSSRVDGSAPQGQPPVDRSRPLLYSDRGVRI